MTLPLLMAARVQETLDHLAALKARPRADVAAEERLSARLAELFGPLVDQVAADVEERGSVPADEATSRALLGDLNGVSEQLVQILAEELGDRAATAIAEVEELVAAQAAGKAFGWEDLLRPFGMDRSLFDTMTGLGNRLLDMFTSRTLDAMVAAAEVDLSPEQLRGTLAEMLNNELSRLSRHAVGDVTAQATIRAEEALGVQWHMWITAGDDRVRPAHAAVNGEIARVGERFSNDWLRPGGLGCRCRVVPWSPPEGKRPPAGLDRFREEDLVDEEEKADDAKA